MLRVVVKKMLLSVEYLRQKRKSYPVFAVFVEKYMEESYPGWYSYLSKSACPVCRTLIPDPVQLYFHLTYFGRCSHAIDEIVEEIIDEYTKLYEHTCRKHYINHRKQLVEWLSTYGVRKTAELCKEGARAKNAEKGIRSGVL
jgi:hypothetical protein